MGSLRTESYDRLATICGQRLNCVCITSELFVTRLHMPNTRVILYYERTLQSYYNVK